MYTSISKKGKCARSSPTQTASKDMWDHFVKDEYVDEYEEDEWYDDEDEWDDGEEEW